MSLPPQTHGAYELKFVLPDELVAPVAGWALGHVPADPYAGPNGIYEVNSLYFDTDDLSVFHRQDGHADRKYRIRRYGAEGRVYLEEKEKLRGWVRKRRTPLADADLASGFGASWFGEIARREGLAPRSQVAYRRIARVGEAEGGPIRLTLDRGVRCAEARGLTLPRLDGVAPLDRNILELKFGAGGLPLLFKRLVAEFGLEPDASSKYRLSVEATGLARERAAA